MAVELYPPQSYDQMWWVVALGSLTLAATSWYLGVRTRRKARPARPVTVDDLRAEAKARVTEILTTAHQCSDPRLPVREIAAEVRRFIALTSEHNLDVAGPLADQNGAVEPRMAEVIAFLDRAEAVGFSPDQLRGRAQLEPLGAEAIEVIERWS